MVDKQISNPQALYALQWDNGMRRIVMAINASGRTLYTGDVVVMANNTNAIAGPLKVGGTNTDGQLTKDDLLVPAVSLTKVANDPLVVGVVGVRDEGYIDTIPGGISIFGATSIGGATVSDSGQLTSPTVALLAELGVYPAGSVVPIIVEGPARVHDGGEASATTTIANGDLLTTDAAALGAPGALKTATLGNQLGVAMETSVISAANLQTGDADTTQLTGLTIGALATAQNATTILTNGDPRSAANDAPSNKPTTGIFPNKGWIQINNGGTLTVVAYSAIGATGFTVSATTVSAAAGIAAGTTITYVQTTIRALIKKA